MAVDVVVVDCTKTMLTHINSSLRGRKFIYRSDGSWDERGHMLQERSLQRAKEKARQVEGLEPIMNPVTLHLAQG